MQALAAEHGFPLPKNYTSRSSSQKPKPPPPTPVYALSERRHTFKPDHILIFENYNAFLKYNYREIGAATSAFYVLSRRRNSRRSKFSHCRSPLGSPRHANKYARVIVYYFGSCADVSAIIWFDTRLVDRYMKSGGRRGMRSYCVFIAILCRRRNCDAIRYTTSGGSKEFNVSTRVHVHHHGDCVCEITPIGVR